MSQTLPRVAHEHHERILHHVDLMPAIADGLVTATSAEVRRGVDETRDFLTATLLPHLEAAERTLYPELERMYQNRHSMTPMRREHDEIRHLVQELARLAEAIDAGHATVNTTLGLRRVMFQLYALLKVHLAEEEIYLRIVDHEVPADVADMLAAALEHPGMG